MRIEIKKACRWRNVRSWTRKFPGDTWNRNLCFYQLLTVQSDIGRDFCKNKEVGNLNLVNRNDRFPSAEFPTLSFNSLRTADVSPRSSPLKDVSWGGTSATERQKFHTDDAKSARNPVRSANWWTDCCFSYRIYYVNWLIYVISMELLSRSRRRTSFSGDEREETSVVRRLFI